MLHRYLSTPLRWLLCVLWTAGASAAPLGHPWETLPPTPHLPAGTVNHYANIHGARIWFAQWGCSAAARPVLLLHSGYSNSNYFGFLISALVAHGYCALAIDSRGHGRSTSPNEPYSYRAMASDIEALLEQLVIPAVDIVGWGDGGIMAYVLALEHPGRIRSIFGYGVNADPTGLAENFDQSAAFATFLARVPVEYRALSPTADRWESFTAAINQMWATEPQFTAEQLRNIKIPVVVADGEYEEAIRPEHTRYLAAMIPGAQLLILPNVGHFAMLQAPAAFDAAVIGFLKNAAPRH